MTDKLISRGRAIAAALMVLVAAGCSSDKTDDPTSAPVTGAVGEVQFSVSLPDGVGEATDAAPAVVAPGETLSINVSQTSSYKDPDGTTFTCEPQVHINIAAQLDTVHASTIDDLRAVTPGSDIHTDKSGSQPQSFQTLQTFEVGGNKINFDITHEVYTHINSDRQHVEMPYILPSAARLGGNTAEEVADETLSRAAASVVTGVTVRPLVPSRGATITETKEYAVSVRLSLDLESKNACTPRSAPSSSMSTTLASSRPLPSCSTLWPNSPANGW